MPRTTSHTRALIQQAGIVLGLKAPWKITKIQALSHRKLGVTVEFGGPFLCRRCGRACPPFDFERVRVWQLQDGIADIEVLVTARIESTWCPIDGTQPLEPVWQEEPDLPLTVPINRRGWWREDFDERVRSVNLRLGRLDLGARVMLGQEPS